MEHHARFEMTEEYFAESYDQWLKCRSKYRRWELHIGAFLVICAIVAFVYGPIIVSALLLFFGVCEIVDFFLVRRKWLRQRIAARSKNAYESVVVTISKAGLYQKGPTSEGTITWDGVKQVIPTDKGLFMSAGDGLSVYIPDSSMETQEFKGFAISAVASEN